MAAGYARVLSHGVVEVLSAGSQPREQINPMAVAVMLEDGINIAANSPKLLATEDVEKSDVVITMGCGDVCPYFPGKRFEDWILRTPPASPSRLSAQSAIRSKLKSCNCCLSSQHKAISLCSQIIFPLGSWMWSASRWLYNIE